MTQKTVAAQPSDTEMLWAAYERQKEQVALLQQRWNQAHEQLKAASKVEQEAWNLYQVEAEHGIELLDAIGEAIDSRSVT